MRISLVVTPLTDSNLRLAAQVGATDIVARFPGHYGLSLEALQQKVESFGLRLGVVEGYIPHDLVVHGRPGRDTQIDDIINLLQEMGRLHVPICCYNFMPDDDWSRTSVNAPERGGARVTAFDAAQVVSAPSARGRPISAERLWDNLAYFLERAVPIAAAAGVRLALHPDDPPLTPLGGQDRILCRPEAFDRVFALAPNSANGVCFCQGTFASMGDLDIPALIHHFGRRVHYVHFRDVMGAVPSFRETFHDNGKTDMAAAMRAYAEIGFDGPIRPDHVPTLEGETNEFPGYHMLGRLFAVGYMRGLIQATRAKCGS
jgi:mannonate dehydratase